VTLWLLAIAAGATVANLYFSQPLLGMIGAQLGAPPSVIGLVSTLTQAGYAAGMVLIVPLGDSRERRGLLAASALASAAALLLTGLAPSVGLLLLASFALGLATVAPQLAVPFAAGIVRSEERGRALGKVMSGLLLGILLSRVLSGAIGAHLGWRALYFLAAPAMVALAILLRLALPAQQPEGGLRYLELLRSLPRIAREEPLLRRHALLGACTFGAFSVFWTTLAFVLAAPPYGYGSAVAGAFGLLGAAGALAAPIAGRLADRYGSRAVNLGAIAVVLLSYVILAAGGRHLVALAAGVMLLDLGVQANHISNQTRVLGLSHASRNRVNTLYMVTYFAGGALGSATGSAAWSSGGWLAVCGVGAGFSLAALAVFFLVAPGEARRLDAASAHPHRAGRSVSDLPDPPPAAPGPRSRPVPQDRG
jgi:predicted MFS family arabinose efflux permease